LLTRSGGTEDFGYNNARSGCARLKAGEFLLGAHAFLFVSLWGAGEESTSQPWFTKLAQLFFVVHMPPVLPLTE
jgi:hypothetical protein